MATMQTELYYCHRCDRQVHLNQDGKCSSCNEGFIEQIENDENESTFHIVQEPTYFHDMSDNALFTDSRQTITNIIQTLFGPDGLQSMDFRSNPSDYIFTDESFDNIVTRIMNQFEQSGPPPASNQDLAKLKSRIVEKDVGACTICLNDYEAGEEINELPCQHEYHAKCVKEWLTKHGTCPICRKDLSGKDTRINDAETNNQTSTSD